MPPAQALAYPLLLAAVYGLYRVGRGTARHAGLFEHVRLLTLALALAVVALLEWRLAASGHLGSPLALAGAVLAIAAVSGLFGLHALHVFRGWRARPAPAG